MRPYPRLKSRPTTALICTLGLLQQPLTMWNKPQQIKSTETSFPPCSQCSQNTWGTQTQTLDVFVVLAHTTQTFLHLHAHESKDTRAHELCSLTSLFARRSLAKWEGRGRGGWRDSWPSLPLPLWHSRRKGPSSCRPGASSQAERLG